MRRRGDTGIYHRRSGGLSYGNRWGVVMLDFDSPFVPGDMGNASTYTTPALFERVPDLSVDAILSDDDSAFARRVIDAAVALVNRGATAITSNCGFMIRYQAAVADALNGVPVVLSSLMQLPFIAATIPAGGRVGIVTASDRVLTSEFIGNTFPGLGERVLIAGLQDAPHFHATMFAGSDDLNADGIREEVVEAVHRLLGDAPPYPTARNAPGAVHAVLLECAALPAYAAAIQERVPGLPVYDFWTAAHSIDQAQNREPFLGFY